MNGKKVVDAYPKTTEKIINWIKEAHKSTGQPDIDQAIQNMTPVAIGAMITMGSPRFLYDYFDSVGIYVTPYPFHGYEKIIWYPSINGAEIEKEQSDMKGEVHIAYSREEAEEISFIEAFKIAENG